MHLTIALVLSIIKTGCNLKQSVRIISIGQASYRDLQHIDFILSLNKDIIVYQERQLSFVVTLDSGR